MKVLVVDDSSFFRRRIIEFLSSDERIEVIGEAVDGMDAIEKTKELNPDVITMDIEMPKLDGISAVKKIRETKRTPILMFSSLTHEGAKATFEALDAGASDFLPKRSATLFSNSTVRSPNPASQPSRRQASTALISSSPYDSNLFGAYQTFLGIIT